MSNSVNLSLDVTKTGIQNPLIKVRQGDGGFETLHTTVTSNGEPLDLQGWTITFMGTTAGNHKIVDANVKVVEAPNGIFDYTPSKAWGMDIGEFKIAYFKFVKGDGSASSANFRVNVIEAVDLTQEEAQNYISVVDATIEEAKEHLTNSLADVTASVAATSSAASSMAVYVSSTASSAVSQVSSAASSASLLASNAISQVNGAADVYVKKVQQLPDDAHDFSVIASNMTKYQGTWYVDGTEVANGPKDHWQWSTIEVVGGFGSGAGIIRAAEYGSNKEYITTVNSGNIVGWKAVADDDSVSNTYIKKSNSLPDEAFDFNYLATHMQAYQGTWWTSDNPVSNAPAANWTWSVIKVIAGNSETSGMIITTALLTNDIYLSIVNYGTVKEWKLISNDTKVVHNTGTETIAGDKTFTGVLNATGLKVSGDDYKNVVSGSTNYLGLTISFVRIGKQVTFTSSANAFNTSVSVGLTNNVLPSGFRPALQQNVYATNQDGANKFFSFDPSGSVYSYSAYTSGTQPRISGTYITTDAWPV